MLKFIKLIVIVWLIGFVGISNVTACVFPPYDHTAKLDYILRQSGGIAIVTVLESPKRRYFSSARTDGTSRRYWRMPKGETKFRVEEVLKGNYTQEFSFYQIEECKHIIEFVEGATYLIINGAPIGIEYQRVKKEFDVWTLRVKTQLASKNKISEPQMTTEKWLDYAEIAFMAVVKDCENPQFSIRKVIKGKYNDQEYSIKENLHPLTATNFSKDDCVEDKEVFVFFGGSIYELYFAYIDEKNATEPHKAKLLTFPNISDQLFYIFTHPKANEEYMVKVAKEIKENNLAIGLE